MIKVGDSVIATKTDNNTIYYEFFNEVGKVIEVNGHYITIIYSDGIDQVGHINDDGIVKIKEEKDMFVETITEKKIKKVINGSGKDDYCYSITPFDYDLVKLVIGAKYEDSHCHIFNARSLRELIDGLEEVYEALK